MWFEFFYVNIMKDFVSFPNIILTTKIVGKIKYVYKCIFCFFLIKKTKTFITSVVRAQ